jgi:NAD(P)-dependent dehydrogenase (short-subunit alcohol dehydrogenase family)
LLTRVEYEKIAAMKGYGVLGRWKGQQRSLSNKVVAITGGARGIGCATARALAHAGARVAIGDLDGDVAAEVAADLGGDAFGVGVDVRDHAAFGAFLDGVERRLGPLDVLVNNAGVMAFGLIEAEDEQMTACAIAINLHAVIDGTRLAVQRMKPRGTGHIVNISSMGGRIAGARLATYCATKFGVAGFSEAVALELRGTGVEISVVFSPPCNTEMALGVERGRGMSFVEPEDIAAHVVETLKRPRFEVPVPKNMGPVLWLNRALPFRARAALAGNGDGVFSRIDHEQRAAYTARLERIKATTTRGK